MRDMKHFGLVALVMGFALIAYFGMYFLAADYVDFGDNAPVYLVRYRIGSVSLHRLSSFFEPARRVDDLCFRRRHATVMD
jgi:hypothetical protein